MLELVICFMLSIHWTDNLSAENDGTTHVKFHFHWFLDFHNVTESLFPWNDSNLFTYSKISRVIHNYSIHAVVVLLISISLAASSVPFVQFPKRGKLFSENRKLYFTSVHIPRLGDIWENRDRQDVRREGEISTNSRFKSNTGCFQVLIKSSTSSRHTRC